MKWDNYASIWQLFQVHLVLTAEEKEAMKENLRTQKGKLLYTTNA